LWALETADTDNWALESPDKASGRRADNANANPTLKSPSKLSLQKNLGKDAIELSTLHVQVAMMEQELQAVHELKEENTALREEVQEYKADAQSSRLAANKLSNIMEQLQSLKGEEVDKKQVEYEHIKVEDSWVSFVCQVLEHNKGQMERLREDFFLVVRVVESQDSMVPVGKNATSTHMDTTNHRSNNNDANLVDRGKQWWGGVQQRLLQEELTFDPELRQQLLSEHILFFNQKILEIENDMAKESKSLERIRESLRDQRDKLELEIGSSQFMRDSLRRDDHDLLEQLTAMLIGPVKNLGEF
jgi:hypothetical protein